MCLTSQFCQFAAIVLIGVFNVHIDGQVDPAELSSDCSVYNSVPLPLEAENTPTPKSFPACASYRSYRGIGRSIDYENARACAWQERKAQQVELAQNEKEPVAWVVGGSLILADIYVNGAGVQRNIPLAMRLACESEEPMATTAAPVISKLPAVPAQANRPFEFCHYAATTLTMSFCTSYQNEIENDRRNSYYKSLKTTMTEQQQLSFDALLRARNRYIDEHSYEVYQGGTIRGIRTMGSQEILESLFHSELKHFEKKRWPALSAKQITGASGLLSGELKRKVEQLKKKSKEDIDEGGVTAENLSKVEECWERFLDAWTTFANLRYPSQASAIRAQITLDRYHLVRTIN